jgi:hypothetical protein
MIERCLYFFEIKTFAELTAKVNKLKRVFTYGPVTTFTIR